MHDAFQHKAMGYHTLHRPATNFTLSLKSLTSFTRNCKLALQFQYQPIKLGLCFKT